MRKAPLLAVLIICGVLIASCAPPPPLKSDKYLNDTSLVDAQDSCAQPCFKDIKIGQTTFVDAVSKIKSNTAFSNPQQQDRSTDNPAQAAWSTAAGEQCCNMIEDSKTGIVQALLVRVAPKMTVGSVIKKYDNPPYIIAGDYSSSESVIQLIYPDKGIIVWVVPGDANSTLQESSPVVAVLYLDIKQLNNLLTTADLRGWDGYKPYKSYITATPVRTAVPTVSGTPPTAAPATPVPPTVPAGATTAPTTAPADNTTTAPTANATPAPTSAAVNPLAIVAFNKQVPFEKKTLPMR